MTVAQLLPPASARLFFAQNAMDQAHALEVARRVQAEVPERSDLIRAALLHDVGKRHAGLGVIGRSIASMLAILRLPKPRRARAYLDHGRLGAKDLKDVGEGDLVIRFAGGHHGPAPADVEPAAWRVLEDADDA